MDADTKLTAGEVGFLTHVWHDSGRKALRIIDALTAENERLRAEYEAMVLRLHSEVRRCDAAESRLATADAENERLRAENEQLSDGPALLADANYHYEQLREDWTRECKAARAAESRLATAVGLLGKRPAEVMALDAWDRELRQAQHRTEAEQAVFTALEMADATALRFYMDSPLDQWVRNVCRAELARREAAK